MNADESRLQQLRGKSNTWRRLFLAIARQGVAQVSAKCNARVAHCEEIRGAQGAPMAGRKVSRNYVLRATRVSRIRR